MNGGAKYGKISNTRICIIESKDWKWSGKRSIRLNLTAQQTCLAYVGHEKLQFSIPLLTLSIQRRHRPPGEFPFTFSEVLPFVPSKEFCLPSKNISIVPKTPFPPFLHDIAKIVSFERDRTSSKIITYFTTVCLVSFRSVSPINRLCYGYDNNRTSPGTTTLDIQKQDE